MPTPACSAKDSWDPQQYDRFQAERSQPFWDLAALLQPVAAPTLLDLGCGTGELTAQLHARIGASTTLGIDNSTAMLEKAAPYASDDVRFESGDIAAVDAADTGTFDLADLVGSADIVFSNAAMQWVPDHESVLARWATLLRQGGQLAVQVPSNADHPSHVLSAEVATESPFVEAMGGTPPPDPVLGVLKPEQYAVILDKLGFTEQHVRLQVYGHRLDTTADVVEWTKGTSLTRFRTALNDDALFDAFVARYRQRLLDCLGEQSPFFYPFKRVLLWGRMT
ncbi:MAG: methyltransferase domain-containing protein [Actinobacteria bacterium]|nr:methyltransferase domain-containing protein [Actinomycetota bacterium]